MPTKKSARGPAQAAKSTPTPSGKGGVRATVQRLWNWVKSVKPHPKALAWCHTTRAYDFRDMVESGECRIQPCTVFSEDLLYFFYGRPAYRVGNHSMRDSAELPDILLFDPSLVDTGKRLYPFDSGAVEGDRMSERRPRGMTLGNFALECGSDPVKRFVAAFYESNDHYLKTQVRKDIKKEVKKYGGEFEVTFLIQVLQDAGIGKVDDRIMAVELQVATSIRLDSPALMGVIYPDELEEAEWFTPFFRERGIRWDRYEPHPAKVTMEYQAQLEKQARDIQASMGYV